MEGDSVTGAKTSGTDDDHILQVTRTVSVYGVECEAADLEKDPERYWEPVQFLKFWSYLLSPVSSRQNPCS